MICLAASVLNTAYNHCLQPASAGNCQLKTWPIIIVYGNSEIKHVTGSPCLKHDFFNINSQRKMIREGPRFLIHEYNSFYFVNVKHRRTHGACRLRQVSPIADKNNQYCDVYRPIGLSKIYHRLHINFS